MSDALAGDDDEGVVRRQVVVALAVVALPVLALAGCNAVASALGAKHAATTSTLHEEARALVPDEARIVAEEESACTEFRSFPSCVVILLDWTGPYEQRLAAVEQRIRARDWDPAPNAPQLGFRRDDLQANLGIHRRGSRWDQLCARRDPADLDRYDRDRCLDSITVRTT